MTRIWKCGVKQRRNYPIRVIRVNPGAAFGRVVYRLRRQNPPLLSESRGHILTTHTHPSVNDFRAVCQPNTLARRHIIGYVDNYLTRSSLRRNITSKMSFITSMLTPSVQFRCPLVHPATKSASSLKKYPSKRVKIAPSKWLSTAHERTFRYFFFWATPTVSLVDSAHARFKFTLNRAWISGMKVRMTSENSPFTVKKTVRNSSKMSSWEHVKSMNCGSVDSTAWKWVMRLSRSMSRYVRMTLLLLGKVKHVSRNSTQRTFWRRALCNTGGKIVRASTSWISASDRLNGGLSTDCGVVEKWW